MAFPPPTEKQAKILWTSITALAVGILLTLIAALLLGVAWVANTLSSVLIPLAIAGIVAYLLDPLVDWFHKKRGMQRQSAIILVFTIALMLVGGLVASIVPALIGQATKLTTEFLLVGNIKQIGHIIALINFLAKEFRNLDKNIPGKQRFLKADHFPLVFPGTRIEWQSM